MMQITSIGEILFDIYNKQKKIGGAPFNFIYHIIKLTGEGNFISRIGKDPLGNEVLEFFRLNKISSDYLQIDNIYFTGTAKPELNNEKIPVWNIKTETAYDFIELNKEIDKLVDEKTGCIYFGTLAQRKIISRKTIQSLFKKSKKYFYDLNIRQNFYSKEIVELSLKAAHVVKLNIDELIIIKDLFFEPSKISLSQDETADILINKFKIDLLCITMGGKGAALYKGNDSCCYQIDVKQNDIVDTIGAGDAYAAILCIGYLNNWDIRKTNRLASEFAAEIIKIQGAIPADDSLYNYFKKVIND
ncbi:MAG: PfkB family carbohydrate kinase [Ignavibacteriaceae bacterium]